MKAKEGSKVKIEYEGKLDDGTVFDSSEKHGKPLEFEIGKGMVIKGFEEAIIGMEKGQEKEVTIKPEEGYGEHNDQLIKKVPREQLPKEQEPIKGMMLLLSSPDGRQFPVKIEEVTDKEITLDLNHPLAGKTLHFKIKLVEIS